jgi:hypothetical protein
MYVGDWVVLNNHGGILVRILFHEEKTTNITPTLMGLDLI